MSVIDDLGSLKPSTAAWLVKMNILNYLRGVELAYRRLGDEDGSVFLGFVAGVLPIRKAEEFKHLKPTNSPDYRGMIAMTLDDIGFRDHDQRDAIMELLTGVTRAEEAEAYRQHRISQGDSWLRSLREGRVPSDGTRPHPVGPAVAPQHHVLVPVHAVSSNPPDPA